MAPARRLSLLACSGVACGSALFSGVVAVGADCRDPSSAETCTADGTVEESALLQRTHRRQALSSPSSAASEVAASSPFALTFEGGGWLALSAEAAVLAGVAAQVAPSEPVAALLKDVDIISSTSGGTWLSVSLAYSDMFNQWMDSIKDNAASPAKVEAAWKQWVDRMQDILPDCTLLETVAYAGKLMLKIASYGGFKKIPGASLVESGMVAQPDSAQIEELRGMLEQYGLSLDTQPSADEQATYGDYAPIYNAVNHLTRPGASDADVPYRLKAAISVGGLKEMCEVFRNSWDVMIELMLKGTAGIPPEATLASEHLPWVDGKTLIQTASVPQRSAIVPSIPIEATKNYLDRRYLFWEDSVTYVPVSGHPQYLPVKFQWAFSQDSSSDQVYNFCATEDCFGTEWQYMPKSSSNNGPVDMSAAWSSAFSRTGLLPISKTAAASSAFDGATDVAEAGLERPPCVTGNGQVMAAKTGHGKAFSAGEAVNSRLPKASSTEAAALAAEAALFPLSDGGDTDLTGIANAVAAGAKRILSIQIAFKSDGLPNSFDMFDAPGRGGAGILFKDVSSADMMTIFNDHSQGGYLENKDESSNLLGIRYFVKRLQLVDNEWFNTKASSGEVEVAFVFIRSTGIYIGPPSNTFLDFGPLMADIVKLLGESPAFAKKLGQLFEGNFE